MALIASDFTIQIMLALIGFVFLFGGGFIQKLGATGLFMTGLGLAITTQSYVSDLSTVPNNVFLFFPANLQRAMVIIFAICSLISIALLFLNLRKLIQLSTAPIDENGKKIEESEFAKKKRREEFFEELV